ncbi:NDUFB10 [Cordylochernes scorpioides]|uniref:NADH dehydrogenase [ubiquinone] 1 beta subcomplex subunit 10 n=1 Tax=Cordylochernes scorpioides TaxID=51811 RepID=A0ABY6LMU7_9ARAC|nr:NDUFB10 [Cordylochernes scorpioides]UYV82530.1 NDUFB10 [Cordylochernes scorpioides]
MGTAGDNPFKDNFIHKFLNGAFNLLDKPTRWFRANVRLYAAEKVVESNRPSYPYYHRKYNRVPTIDECYENDVLCIWEADYQYKLDQEVESRIVFILRDRRDDCILNEQPNHMLRCKKQMDDHDLAVNNYFIKYGEMGAHHTVIDALMKQKHRLVYERRHPDVNLYPE